MVHELAQNTQYAPEGSLDDTPLSFSSYSLTPALVCRLEVGARPKRPAARNRVVDAIMICTETG
jgi:hypothetical protein